MTATAVAHVLHQPISSRLPFGGKRLAGRADMAGLGALVEQFVAQSVNLGRFSTLTAKGNRYVLRNFAEDMGWPDVRALTPAMIQDWQESLAKLAPATKRTRCSLIKCFCRWLVEQGWLETDPAAAMRVPRQPRSVPRAMHAGAVASTMEHCPDTRSRLVVVLMVQLGLRCIEVSRLEMGDIDPDLAFLRVVGKGGHQRMLPIPNEAREAMERYLMERGRRAGPLIQSHLAPGRGLKSATLVKYVSTWQRNAGVKRAAYDGVSAHAFRHTMASDLVRQGVHIRKVQLALGHESLASTQIYLAHDVSGLAEAMGGRRYGQAISEQAKPRLTPVPVGGDLAVGDHG